MPHVRELAAAARAGDRQAGDDLFRLVYHEPPRLALHSLGGGWSGGGPAATGRARSRPPGPPSCAPRRRPTPPAGCSPSAPRCGGRPPGPGRRRGVVLAAGLVLAGGGGGWAAPHLGSRTGD